MVLIVTPDPSKPLKDEDIDYSEQFYVVVSV